MTEARSDGYDIHTQPDWVELRTTQDFRARQQGSFGVIVIADGTRGTPIAHHHDCPFVTEDDFVEKVIAGRERNGRYWWAKNSRIAADAFGARRCRHPGDPLSR